MASAFSFKMPSIIPQDLQLIHDLIGEVVPPPAKDTPPDAPTGEDSIDSSDSDADSEREVEEDILSGLDEQKDGSPGTAGPSESAAGPASDSDSDSDSDAEDLRRWRASKANKADEPAMDEDETGPSVTSAAQVKTAHEITDVEVIIPEMEEIGPDNELEKVGEVMSIVNNVVIVKGSASAIAHRASETALDSDTLLVFEDRKVLGYIAETFGPTTQPLYQVKFNQQYPLDPEKVQVLRPVFHVPARSKYVFVRDLRHFKGSDASNLHDEEPGEDEIEFSDDEQEAAYKARRRDRSRSRSVSVAPSRGATPTPSQMRDQDMVDDLYGQNPYDDPGSYNDMDFGAGPSRPPPIPYDDPYSDSYGVLDPQPSSSTPAPPGSGSPRAKTKDVNASPRSDGSSSDDGSVASNRARGRGRGRGSGRGGSGRRDERGRGRGRGRRGDRGRGRGGDDRRFSSGYADARPPRPLSPTSQAIARATGQYADGSAVSAEYPIPSSPSAALQHGVDGGGWAYPQYPVQQQYDLSFEHQAQGYQQPYGHQYGGYDYGGMGYHGGGDGSGAWNGEWANPGDSARTGDENR
ncbi:Gar1/Naf1 RNA binding region-domain-containing protein [Amylocystis lapponica]|nr:Gar1/Naf1 RNA binding region-domain-containing protein [Amylocystis lapponica]